LDVRPAEEAGVPAEEAGVPASIGRIPFVGRQPELAALLKRLEAAGQG
jgi:hypothetical protein